VSRNASFHEGGIAGALLAPIKFAFALTLGLAGITVAAWIIDWTFVFKVWPDGVERLQRILAADLARALELVELQGGMTSAIAGTANGLYALTFQLTGIHDMGMRFAEGTALTIPDTIVRNTYLANREAIEVAMVGTQLLGVRLAMLGFSLPLLTLLYVVAVVDGLSQRAIRRAGGGRESASLYHRAKHLQIVLLAGSGALSLLVPVSLDPRWIMATSAGALAVLARVQWAYYKKHV